MEHMVQRKDVGEVPTRLPDDMSKRQPSLEQRSCHATQLEWPAWGWRREAKVKLISLFFSLREPPPRPTPQSYKPSHTGLSMIHLPEGPSPQTHQNLLSCSEA